MKRVCGYGLFCFSLGMFVMLILSNSLFMGIIIMLLCLLVGYLLFCH